MAEYFFYICGRIADFSRWRVGEEPATRKKEKVYETKGTYTLVAIRKKALSLLKTRIKNNKYSEIEGIQVYKDTKIILNIRYDKEFDKFWTEKGALVKADGTLSKKTIFDVWDGKN